MKTDKRILILTSLNDNEKLALESKAPGCQFLYPQRQDLSRELINSAHIILGHINVADLAGSENLEWLHIFSAGVKEFVSSDKFPARTILTNSSGAFGAAIAEHLLAMLLMIQKRLYRYHDYQNRQEWHPEGNAASICGSTTLVVGLGDIGCEFAQRMKLLGSKTIGMKRHASPKPEFLDELHLIEDLDRILPQADIVSLSLPDTPETYHLMNKNRLTEMKKTAILLNVGRGNVIDTNALCDLMEGGHLMGAGLDVTDPEPLPSNHRLWKIKNVVITPHVSALIPSTRDRQISIAIDNLDRYMKGEPLRNVVDFKIGY